MNLQDALDGTYDDAAEAARALKLVIEFREATGRRAMQALSHSPEDTQVSTFRRIRVGEAQEGCPWNHEYSAGSTESAFSSLERPAAPDTRELARAFLTMTPSEFTTDLKHTHLSRAKLSELKRNACAVLVNVGSVEDVPALVAALDVESDPAVLEALRAALAACGG